METAQQEITTLERLVGAQGASPLFARLADLYLQAGRPKDALRVCDAGLANFPFYSTGHFVKGRALIALEMTNEARRELEFVRDWLPTNPTIWSYLDTLPASDEELLTTVSEPEAPTAISAPISTPISTPVSATAVPVESAEQPGGFFGAITGGEVPVAAVDTSSPPGAPAEENVFGLPSEAPTGFGGFGGGTTDEAPQAFSGFGGFGGTTDTPAVTETETSAPVAEEPAVSFEDTVSSALGDGAPGFIPATAPVELMFEAYADRMRLELGPTGLITIEQFLQGDGIVPGDASSSFSEMSSDVDPIAVSESVVTEPEQAPGGFGFDGLASSEPEPTNALQEGTLSGFSGPDFSGLSIVEESSSVMPAVETPATMEGEFSGPAFDGPPADTSIEGLTEKLQSAKKITPVIDFSSKTSSDSSEENPMVTSGFVTPTLAEIYAKQGWFDDAIKAYRALSKTKPAEREKFEERIAELEEEKKKQA